MSKQIIDPSRFRLGFELETTQAYGLRYGDSVPSTEVDEVATAKAKVDAFANILARNLQSHRYSENTLTYLSLIFGEENEEVYRKHYDIGLGMNSLYEIAREIGKDFTEPFNLFRQRIMDNVQPVRTSRQSDAAYFKSKLPPSIQPYFAVERDGSVSGPEFMTVGGHDIRETKRLARLILNEDLVVDRGCSFHIHLSVQGFNHFYGLDMQGHMLQYILSNIHRVPPAVLSRWDRDDWRYYKLQESISADRYDFVAFRDSEEDRKPPTWEFRCWGNISEYEEAATCIDLSVEAYTWAHRQVVLLNRVNNKSRNRIKQEILYKTRSILANNIPRKMGATGC